MIARALAVGLVALGIFLLLIWLEGPPPADPGPEPSPDWTIGEPWEDER